MLKTNKLFKPVSSLMGIVASTAFFTAVHAQDAQTSPDKPEDHNHHFVHTSTADIPLNPNIVCGNAKALYETQSDCYSLYAANVTAYAEAAAAPYMDLNTLDEVVQALEALSPTELIVKPEDNTIIARFKNEEGKLHNPNGSAFIKINPVEKTYMEMRQINGNFYSAPDQPSYIKYKAGQEVDLQWDGPLGTHNPYGPAFVNVNLESNTMVMAWMINGIATSLDCETGLTASAVN